jgi:alpha-glucosidase
LAYLLAAPSRVPDAETWLKPGKIAWDCHTEWSIYGVDFRAGANNETYTYYIDLAAQHGIEYYLLTPGSYWVPNRQADTLMPQFAPEINIAELVEYGKERNVGIVPEVGYRTMKRNMDNVFKHYAALGVKGFKIDYADRGDQPMVDFYYRCAAAAAKYKLFVDFHDAYKPTELQRTFPNVLAFESVFEQPTQRTRCRQLAEYVVFASPFSVLCDDPSDYHRASDCVRFIADIPAAWDETLPLDSKIGEYTVVARRRGADWYVGGLTNSNNRSPRDYTLDLSFLADGDYALDLFRDGINAVRAAQDYKHETPALPKDKKLRITMVPGGGFAIKITKK